MVYKKYIKRGNRVFGPYYYESYRDENGKVRTRFISGPTEKDKTKTKKLPYKNLILVFAIFAFLLFLFVGNLKYFGITGKTTYTTQDISILKLSSIEIAERIAEGEIVSNVDVRGFINLELRQPDAEKNKVMRFDAPEGKITLSFNLLDYTRFIETRKEKEIDAVNFDIFIQESAGRFKWGYQIELTDLLFMARIDIKSQENIRIIDKQTLKIGSNYLSFSDLVDAGYFLNFNRPIIFGEFDGDILEIDGSPAYIDGIDGSPAYIEPLEEPPEKPKGSPDYVTGRIIKSITGFFAKGIEGLVGFIIHGFGGITGLIVQENQISVYVGRNFTGEKGVGEIIYLDPSLIRITDKEESEIEMPAREIVTETEECVPDWVCEEWSECEAIYNLNDLIEGRIFLREEKTQYCSDKNKCIEDKFVIKGCDKLIPAIVKRVERCFKTYVEIYDEKEGILISRLEMIDGVFRKLNVQFLLTGDFCPYCYDSIKNYDEDEVDCAYTRGRNCPVCKGKASELKPFPLILIILIVLILLCLLLIILYLILDRKTGKRSEVREVRRKPFWIRKKRIVKRKSRKPAKEEPAEKRMLKDFAAFGRKVQRLKEIKSELASLNTAGFEKEAGSVRAKLRDVSLLSQTEKELRNLKKKLRHK